MHTVAQRISMATIVNPATGCWEWQSTIDKDGYGKIKIGGRKGRVRMAHRVTFEMYVGPIPTGLEIDHLCRVRNCVNPEHLEAVTPKVNTYRSLSPSGINARKTHCKNGHPFSGENLALTSSGRCCRTCRRETQRRRVA